MKEMFEQRCEMYGVRDHSEIKLRNDARGVYFIHGGWVEACAENRDTAERAAIVAALIVQGSPVPLSLLGETVDDISAQAAPTAPDDLALSRRILTYIRNMSVSTAFDCVHEITGGADGNEADARDYAVIAEQLNACATTIESMIRREEGAP
jgi:hypothetical protein